MILPATTTITVDTYTMAVLGWTFLCAGLAAVGAYAQGHQAGYKARESEDLHDWKDHALELQKHISDQERALQESGNPGMIVPQADAIAEHTFRMPIGHGFPVDPGPAEIQEHDEHSEPEEPETLPYPVKEAPPPAGPRQYGLFTTRDHTPPPEPPPAEPNPDVPA